MKQEATGKTFLPKIDFWPHKALATAAAKGGGTNIHINAYGVQ